MSTFKTKPQHDKQHGSSARTRLALHILVSITGVALLGWLVVYFWPIRPPSSHQQIQELAQQVVRGDQSLKESEAYRALVHPSNEKLESLLGQPQAESQRAEHLKNLLLIFSRNLDQDIPEGRSQALQEHLLTLLETQGSEKIPHFERTLLYSARLLSYLPVPESHSSTFRRTIALIEDPKNQISKEVLEATCHWKPLPEISKKTIRQLLLDKDTSKSRLGLLLLDKLTDGVSQGELVRFMYKDFEKLSPSIQPTALKYIVKNRKHVADFQFKPFVLYAERKREDPWRDSLLFLLTEMDLLASSRDKVKKIAEETHDHYLRERAQQALTKVK